VYLCCRVPYDAMLCLHESSQPTCWRPQADYHPYTNLILPMAQQRTKEIVLHEHGTLKIIERSRSGPCEFQSHAFSPMGTAFHLDPLCPEVLQQSDLLISQPVLLRPRRSVHLRRTSPVQNLLCMKVASTVLPHPVCEACHWRGTWDRPAG